ncbi:lipase member I-like [Malaya genurostris]|uniref:lipase member I-like n=1 Tax=Malaya genurostris TaxID=325434 RepID=UPI0026F38216|nr:lipase member I-like [Malaya genurostris]
MSHYFRGTASVPVHFLSPEMSPASKLALFVLTASMVVEGINCGLLDMFNTNSDYHLAASMDAVFGALRNDISNFLEGSTEASVEKDVTFWCGNRNSSQFMQTFFNDTDLDSKIDFTKPLTFIIHGWLDNATRIWVKTMARDVIKYGDTNVCSVNWSRLARYNYYQVAMNHTLIVSEYMTKFVEYLTLSGLALENVTFVGHSMGAQISGQVGKNFNGKIGKIYGLDPAGPCFTFPRDRGLQFRLDSSDARFVQMILTSRFTIGVGVGEGHENFYPNGGYSPQTNCAIPVTSDAEFADQIMCSHLHATTLFRLSLNPAIVYRARRCVNWPVYLLTLCKSNEASVIGVHSKQKTGHFYLRTSAFSPFTSLIGRH